MDQRLQYEQLIGAKLQNLSIPDLEDMIWARVKAQLDIDMPTDDDDGGGNSPASPKTRGPVSWGLSVIIIALITIFIFFQTRPTTPEENTVLPLNTQPAAEPFNQPTGPPLNYKIITTSPLIPQVSPTPVGTSVDTTSAQPGLTMPVTTVPDSISNKAPDSIFTQAQPPPVKFDTLPAKKKGKGVRGLNDDDYRIVPKNDQ